MPGIHLISMPETDSFSTSRINTAVQRTYNKLQKLVNNEVDLKLQFKKEQGTNNREKHVVHSHLSAPGITILSTETDWQLVKAVQKALKTLERETVKQVKRKR